MESMKCAILKRRNEMAFFNTKRFTLWPIEVVMIIVFSVTGVVAYAAESVPNTFTAGTTISANQINQNFTSLATAMPAIKSVVVIDTFVAMPATTSSGGTTDVVTLSVNAPADGNMYLTATVYASLVGSPCTRGDLSTLGPDFQILESSDGNSVNTSIRGPAKPLGHTPSIQSIPLLRALTNIHSVLHMQAALATGLW
jgi:hypothetical protein